MNVGNLKHRKEGKSMGTNFYKLDGTHIGKRSAAGQYCWDCEITLCKNGNEGVHYSASDWYDKCPKCGKSPDDNGANAMWKELGFSKVNGKQKGVSSCCSFTWAITPEKIEKVKFVKDEYGRRYTKADFMKELEFCPIQFFNMVGKEFS